MKRGRGGREVATSPGRPEPQELDEAGGLVPGASGGSMALRHLGFRLLASRISREHICSFKSPSLW